MSNAHSKRESPLTLTKSDVIKQDRVENNRYITHFPNKCMVKHGFIGRLTSSMTVVYSSVVLTKLGK